MDLTAEEFNARHPIGTRVIAYPGVRPEYAARIGMTEYPCLDTRTRSRAWALGHGEPVVKVEGHAGGISLEHIDLNPSRPTTTQPVTCGSTPDDPSCTVSKHAICEQHH
jgi:hypothetical protein